jgi:ATP-dependent helicase/nuclease subunit A
MSGLKPSTDTNSSQRRASDPQASAWVSANAGSGKTYVLSNRVIRLLLEGHEPSGVLCITFTKAAAANMSNAVFNRLSAWTAASDEELDKALLQLGEPRPDAQTRARARRLFARALDTPGGLKVLTIHGFCESLLHQFPFEARVPAAFTVVEERQQNELLSEARAHVLTAAAADPESPLGRALARLITSTSDMTLQRALNEVLSKGDELERLMRRDGVSLLPEIVRRLRSIVGETRSTEEIEAEMLGHADALAGRADVVEWLRSSGSKSDADLANCLTRAGAGEPAECREAYLDVFLTQKRAPRADSRFVTKALREGRGDLMNLLINERERLADLCGRRNAAIARERSEALLILADAIWTYYRTEKVRRGALDFADLIHAARRLLSDISSSWVHFKLDKGVDHVLVDEAQDISPEQWEIVQGLTSEFTSGLSARETVRTMFAVGDEKQSIFGFQGAAPARFGEMRRHFDRLHREADKRFENVQLTQSFRSAGDVLGAVDVVFESDAARRGLTFDDEKTLHQTARPDAPGRVEIWPLEKAEAGPDGIPWNAPFDTVSAKNPAAVLSGRIADAVRGWIHGRDLDGPCAAVPPGDILILVRQRGPLFEAILRKLKEKGVPVAGADRLDLGKHIAVLDLLALADALLLAENDLALASVLKSPLFDFNDDDLMRIAHGRAGSLRAALRHADDRRFRDADEKLVRFARLAAHRRPFDFYAAVLGESHGRRDFHRRLGHEVDDVLDEFLSYAMSYGESETATLAGFAAWMRAAPAVIKRDLETGGGNVRVMTVHGAKGLEAGLVVLADTGLTRHASKVPVIFRVKEERAKESDLPVPVWSPGKDADPPALEVAREEEAARDAGEHRRLLYVAMTRAKDRLVVAGHLTDAKKTSAPDNSWYALARGALEPKAEPVEVPGFDEPVLVFQPTRLPAQMRTAESVAPPAPAPAWIFEKLPAERTETEWVAPSRAVQHVFTAGAVDGGPIPAKARGVVLHRLLEELPALPAAERREAAARYLARTGAAWPEAARGALADEALELIADPALLPLLTAPGRAEVPVAGDIPRPGRGPVLVSGQIDRLIVEETRVLILDFKSDRPVPAEVPDSYVAQLALYRALLERVFHGKRVECAVLWTAARRLDHIPEGRLNAALGRVLGMAPVP